MLLAGALIGGWWPTAAAAHEFLVYFRFDTTTPLTDPSRTITEASCMARTSAAPEVVVAAHADRAGPADYNLALSERRGRAVADMLAATGLDRRAIRIDARGESQPAVFGPDGVAEPLNRRATIEVQGDLGARPLPPECEAVMRDMHRRLGLPR
jgi:outer membrane protein OmpA-like peptidoglycan-associated protein